MRLLETVEQACEKEFKKGILSSKLIKIIIILSL